MNKLDLTALLERVRNAVGPDDELQDAIWLAVIPGAQRVNKMAQWPEERPIWEYFDPGRNTYSRSIPNFMSSIDAALALVERVLPGWGVYFRRDKDTCGAGLVFPKYPNATPGHGEGASLPLAILTAILLALTSNQEGNDEA